MRYQKKIWSILKYLANLQLAIILLIFIASSSILGTVIEQNQPLEFYQVNYPSSKVLSWNLITILGLNHIFFTKWFIILIAIFALSITICTFTRQLPILKLSKKLYFFSIEKILKRKKGYVSENFKYYSNYLFYLGVNNYGIFISKNKIYAYKGIIGRFAPIIVHGSMLFILSGAFLGFLNGYTAQEMIPEHEYAHIQNLTASGVFAKVPQNLLIQVENFKIDYSPNGVPSQYYSNITLFENTKIVFKDLIYVNKPLKYKDLFVYQTDWDINGIRLLFNNQPVQIPMSSKLIANNQKAWVGSLSINDNTYNFVMRQLNESILLYDQNGNFVKNLPFNTEFEINGNQLKIIHTLVSSGLQIKSDPGIPIVYFGFLLLIISSLSSYVSFSQIWVAKTKEKIATTGTTNRSVLEFERDFYLIIQKILKEKLPSKI
uniref:Cytochrome c biogenesis protein CcsB n=1 Tax=Porphyridium sordidum TaxID=28024 RepID=A0A1C9CDN5_PORSO|nr:hypothetical protein Psor_021 [Porphyridium sordidum]AOM66496.1 hypothetical protein Psor_021 [Porphyridium sordidum]